ncbi:MAG: HAMP domain-containing histidine kinase [Lachnospiraceae bacterium]|nr:HAMP domain-containing histidine kinase [Lachnospiraceae bacterium]
MVKNREFVEMIVWGCGISLAVSIICGIMLGPAAAAAVLAVGVMVVLISVRYTRKRYADIERLNHYLEKVLAGDPAPDLLDQKEGELSILKANIYKTTTTLKYQKELLSQDKKQLADALADISHQLKTPLTSMMVMNDLLKTEEDGDKREDFLHTQSEQLDRMNWLIQTLLKLSRLDAGTLVMKQETVGSAELVRDVMQPFAIQMELKNIRYSGFGGSMELSCDRNWTVEAMQNMVKNCIEHMQAGDMLTITEEETNLYREICISDTGCGIREEDLPHIFERFYKGKNAGKDSVGIGLALAKSLIESQSGDILVESREGEGTRFHVRFYKTII